MLHSKKDGTTIPVYRLTTLHLRNIIKNRLAKAARRTDDPTLRQQLLEEWGLPAYQEELTRRTESICPACGGTNTLVHSTPGPLQQQTRCSRCPFILTSDTIHHTTLLEKLAL